MNMEFLKRKPNRLKSWNYSSNAAYFVTICLKNKQNLFWNIVGAHSVRPQEIALSDYGSIVDKAIQNIPNHYPNITIDKYCIMPNHIHLIFLIDNGSTLCSPTISIVLKQMKEYVTKQIDQPIWQKSFHDHIIRGQADYEKIWQYIDENPLKWELDCFYTD